MDSPVRKGRSAMRKRPTPSTKASSQQPSDVMDSAPSQTPAGAQNNPFGFETPSRGSRMRTRNLDTPQPPLVPIEESNNKGGRSLRKRARIDYSSLQQGDDDEIIEARAVPTRSSKKRKGETAFDNGFDENHEPRAKRRVSEQPSKSTSRRTPARKLTVEPPQPFMAEQQEEDVPVQDVIEVGGHHSEQSSDSSFHQRTNSSSSHDDSHIESAAQLRHLAQEGQESRIVNVLHRPTGSQSAESQYGEPRSFEPQLNGVQPTHLRSGVFQPVLSQPNLLRGRSPVGVGRPQLLVTFNYSPFRFAFEAIFAPSDATPSTQAQQPMNATLSTEAQTVLQPIDATLSTEAQAVLQPSDTIPSMQEVIGHNEQEVIGRDLAEAVDHKHDVADQEPRIIEHSKQQESADDQDAQVVADVDIPEEVNHDKQENADQDAQCVSNAGITEVVNHNEQESADHDAQYVIDAVIPEVVNHDKQGSADAQEVVDVNLPEVVDHNKQASADQSIQDIVGHSFPEVTNHDKQENASQDEQEDVADSDLPVIVNHGKQDVVDHDTSEVMDSSKPEIATQDAQDVADSDLPVLEGHDEQDAVDHDTPEVMNHDKQDAVAGVVNHDEQKLVDEDMREVMDHDKQDAVDHDMTGAVDHDEQHMVDHGMSEVVNHDEQHVVSHDMSGIVNHDKFDDEEQNRDEQKLVDQDMSRVVDYAEQHMADHVMSGVVNDVPVTQDSREVADHNMQKLAGGDMQEVGHGTGEMMEDDVKSDVVRHDTGISETEDRTNVNPDVSGGDIPEGDSIGQSIGHVVEAEADHVAHKDVEDNLDNIANHDAHEDARHVFGGQEISAEIREEREGMMEVDVDNDDDEEEEEEEEEELNNDLGPYAYLTPYIDGAQVFYPAAQPEPEPEVEADAAQEETLDDRQEQLEEDTPAETPIDTAMNSPVEAPELAPRPFKKAFAQTRPAFEFIELFNNIDGLSQQDLFMRLAATTKALYEWQKEYKKLKLITDDEDNAARNLQEETQFQSRSKAILSKNPDSIPIRKDFVMKGSRAPNPDLPETRYLKQQDKIMAHAYGFDYDDRESKVGQQDAIGQRGGLGKTRLRDRPKQTAKAAEAEDPHAVHGKRSRKVTNVMGMGMGDGESASRGSTPMPSQQPQQQSRRRGVRGRAAPEEEAAQPEAIVEDKDTTPRRRGRGGRPRKSAMQESIPENVHDNEDLEEEPQPKRRRRNAALNNAVLEEEEMASASARPAPRRKNSRMAMQEVPSSSFYSTTSAPSTQPQDESRPATASSTATVSTVASGYGLREKRQRRFTVDQEEEEVDEDEGHRRSKRARRAPKKIPIEEDGMAGSNAFVTIKPHTALPSTSTSVPAHAKPPPPVLVPPNPPNVKFKIKNHHPPAEPSTSAPAMPPPISDYNMASIPDATTGNGNGNGIPSAPAQLDNGFVLPGPVSNGQAAATEEKDYGQMTKSEKMSYSMKARWASGSMDGAVQKRRTTLQAKKAAAAKNLARGPPGPPPPDGGVGL